MEALIGGVLIEQRHDWRIIDKLLIWSQNWTWLYKQQINDDGLSDEVDSLEKRKEKKNKFVLLKGWHFLHQPVF